jgi:DNA-binding NarL/FixJ family response regulator
MFRKLNILVVDDHPVVLEGMLNILKQLDFIAEIHKAGEAISAMSIIRKIAIDVVITDINLPEINGIELGRKIHTEFPNINIIGMSTFHDPLYVGELIQAGGKGFITKNSTVSEIESTIRGVMEGQVIISHLLNNQKQVSFPDSQGPIITRREKEVLVLIAEGCTNKEIAEKLFVSLSTVDSHRKNLLAKFDVMNTASLISKAMKSGVL